MKKESIKLSELIMHVEAFITDSPDSISPPFNSSEELRLTLQDYRKRLLQNDFSCLNELNYLFAPTGVLQEHSIDNNWGNEYLKVSSEFDRIYRTVQPKKNNNRTPQRPLKIIKNVLDFFFPPLCVTCKDRLSDTENHICLECIASLPKTNYHKQEENRLEEFLGGKFPFYRAAAFCYFYKSGSIQKIIHEFKYNNNPELAFYMGQLYGNDLIGSDFIENIDYITPVPLHAKRRKERGYNQAEEICKGISQATGIPVCTTAIQRIINNPSQTKKSRTERWENTEGIFAITDTPSLKGKAILLVDDVITTGSTLEAIVKSFPPNESPSISIAAIGMAM